MSLIKNALCILMQYFLKLVAVMSVNTDRFDNVGNKFHYSNKDNNKKNINSLRDHKGNKNGNSCKENLENIGEKGQITLS